MSPDDPRHGTYAGACKHWKLGEPLCDPCHLAAGRVRKRNRHLATVGRAASVPSIGTVRRIQALRALGWSVLAIAHESGMSEKSLRNPCYRGESVYRATADAVAAAYDRLSMRVPEGPYADRERRAAVRRGFVPPLAWDDIDDPHETPDPGYRPVKNRPSAELLAEYEHLSALGESIHQAARSLGVTVDAIEKALERRGEVA